MNRAKSSYWIQTKHVPWGPFDWKLLRDWFTLGWLPPDTQVSEEIGGAWQPASAVERFWIKTKGTTDKLREFESLVLMSTKVALSPALNARIQSLGWPGDVQRLKNYYWGNKLRQTLEGIFPDAQRPLFDDPNWPWSGGSPAEVERHADRMRHERLAGSPTRNQDEILQFFLGSHHGITSFREASQKIGRLLSDPQNRDRWGAQPASPRQVEQLEWASTRLHRPLPKPLTKAKAHELIDAWFEEFSDLELAWLEEKDRRAELEWGKVEVRVVAGEVDDWRKFHGCQPVSDSVVQSVIKTIGSRKENEDIDQFMARFFAALRRQKPALFSGRVASANNRSTRRGTGCMVILTAGLFIFILCVFCVYRVMR